MRILISNDDGYEAKGIKQLAKSLSEIAEVIVVAPNKNKSAASSSLTLGKPLKPIAISLASWRCKHFETAGAVAKSLVTQIDKAPLSYNTIINVNVPDITLNEIKGIKSTRLGNRHKSEPSIQDEKDPSLYWIGENGKEADNGEGTDFHAISNNYVSVTPLQIDLTKYSEVKQVSDWLQKLDY
jgi:5'-nucleotidase